MAAVISSGQLLPRGSVEAAGFPTLYGYGAGTVEMTGYMTEYPSPVAHTFHYALSAVRWPDGRGGGGLSLNLNPVADLVIDRIDRFYPEATGFTMSGIGQVHVWYQTNVHEIRFNAHFQANSTDERRDSFAVGFYDLRTGRKYGEIGGLLKAGTNLVWDSSVYSSIQLTAIQICSELGWIDFGLLWDEARRALRNALRNRGIYGNPFNPYYDELVSRAHSSLYYAWRPGYLLENLLTSSYRDTPVESYYDYYYRAAESFLDRTPFLRPTLADWAQLNHPRRLDCGLSYLYNPDQQWMIAEIRSFVLRGPSPAR